MNTIIKKVFFNPRSLSVLALLASSVPATVWAKDHHRSNGAVQVISSLSFDGQPAAGMNLEQQREKSYLRIEFASGQADRVLDVTHPERIADAKPAPTRKSGSADHVVSRNVSLEKVASDVSAGQPAREEFELWDLSQPGSPQLVEKFSAVYSAIEDERGYIYVLHQGGLSIIRSKTKATVSDRPDYSIYG